MLQSFWHKASSIIYEVKKPPETNSLWAHIGERYPSWWHICTGMFYITGNQTENPPPVFFQWTGTWKQISNEDKKPLVKGKTWSAG